MEKLNATQLVNLVRQIRSANSPMEDDNNTLLDLFTSNMPYPSAANYIFDIKYEEQTDEEIVENACSYKPIVCKRSI